jgi:hypothetical protein
MIDLNHSSGFYPGRSQAPPHAISDAITAAIDAALFIARDPPRRYLGASILGHPCARRICYAATGMPADAGRELTGQKLRIFTLGHVFEEKAAEFLRLAHFDLRTRNGRGEQFGFTIVEGRIAGHIDGAIVAGPVDLPYPLGWECKSLNARSWSDTVKRGVKLSKEIYYGQLQLYMAYMELEHSLFTAINKDTGELWHELVPFDPERAQALSDRAAEIIRTLDAGDLMPRCAPSRDNFTCRFCEFQDRCW